VILESLLVRKNEPPSRPKHWASMTRG
jgi:hypothetical protein